MHRIHPVQSVDDPRITSYRNLKDRKLARRGGRFIAEGQFVVRRLLESSVTVESLLIDARRVQKFAPLIPADTPIYAAESTLLRQIIGFKIHSGILACGLRPPTPTLEQAMAPAAEAEPDRPVTLLILAKVIDAANVGSILRVAAGMGVSGVLLGPTCCDPWWRRSVRVSMGAVFRVPMRRSDDLAADLAALKEQWGVRLVATVCEGETPQTAMPLATASRPHTPSRLGILIGPEDHGLAPEHLALADSHVTIPMAWQTDSLNIAIATAVVLYHYMQVAPISE